MSEWADGLQQIDGGIEEEIDASTQFTIWCIAKHTGLTSRTVEGWLKNSDNRWLRLKKSPKAKEEKE